MSEFAFKHYDGPEFPKDAITKASETLAKNHGMLMEFYLRAWIAETGLNPSECEVVIQNTPNGSRTYARKREVEG